MKGLYVQEYCDKETGGGCMCRSVVMMKKPVVFLPLSESFLLHCFL